MVDIWEYVAACLTCARSKGTNKPSAGLLLPPPTPRRPWSHIAMDFVTRLPHSDGNTIILTVIDWFSKMKKLPLAKETAELMLHHVFRLHGFPMDVVSDRGPQFEFWKFWNVFCALVGASMTPAQWSGNPGLG